MPLDDDLYRFLLQESKEHRERVSTLWLQKFSMLGAIIAFAAIHSEAAARNSTLVAAAILSLPIIAILLDAKQTEFGVHALAIDRFLIRSFPDPPVLGEWERTKWGWSTNPNGRGLIRARTAATITATVVPTCLIAILAILAAGPMLPASLNHPLRYGGIAFCILYLAIGAIWYRVLTGSKPPRL